MAAAEPGEGADPGPGIGEGTEESAVTEADDVGEVDGGEQVPGLLDGELGALSEETALSVGSMASRVSE